MKTFGTWFRSLYGKDKDEIYPMTENEAVSLLNFQDQTFDKADTNRVLKTIQKLGKDEEAIKYYLNKELPQIFESANKKGIKSLKDHPWGKAILTDDFLHQLLGAAALDEIPGLENLKPIEGIKKTISVPFGDISELYKKLGLDPTVEFKGWDEDIGKYFTYHGSHRIYQGPIYIHEAFRRDPQLLAQMLGTAFHEGSHRSDTISAALEAIKNKKAFENISDDRLNLIFGVKPEEKKWQKYINAKINNGNFDKEVVDYIRDKNLIAYNNSHNKAEKQGAVSGKNLSQIVEEYKQKNPGKLSENPDILQFRGLDQIGPKSFHERLIKSGAKHLDKIPVLNLQDKFSGKLSKHWFDKNFPLEGVLGVAKEGIKGIKSVAPYLKTAGKVGLPLAAAASNYAEAREEGLPVPLAAAYAGVEELNPLPISGIDYYKGMEKAAEGRRKNIESMYMPEEMKAEQRALESYMNSPAAKDKAYGTLRNILKNDVDEELVKKLLPKRIVTPFKPED